MRIDKPKGVKWRGLRPGWSGHFDSPWTARELGADASSVGRAGLFFAIGEETEPVRSDLLVYCLSAVLHIRVPIFFIVRRPKLCVPCKQEPSILPFGQALLKRERESVVSCMPNMSRRFIINILLFLLHVIIVIIIFKNLVSTLKSLVIIVLHLSTDRYLFILCKSITNPSTWFTAYVTYAISSCVVWSRDPQLILSELIP